MKFVTGILIGFFLTAILTFATLASAADVTLAWDANDPAPEGYRIFVRESGSAYDYSTPAWQGAGVTGNVTGLAEETMYAFVVRAYVGDLESPDSDEVVYTVPTAQQQIVYPAKPKSILIVFE